MRVLDKIRFGPFSTGLIISLGLHGLILVWLFVDPSLPERPPEPEDTAIEVTLVPPPPPPPPEPEPEPESEPEPVAEAEAEPLEESAPEEPALEEPAPEEPAPEPEVPEEQAPEPEAPEPEAPEPEAPEPEAPEPETPEPDTPEPEAEPQSPPEQAALPPEDVIAADRIPIPTLRPVFEFGAEDRGAEPEPDGGRVDAPDPLAQDAPTDPVEDAETPAPGETAPAISLPEISLPESGLPDTGLGEGEGESLGEAIEAAVTPTDTPVDEAAETAAPSDPEPLAQAEQLFSPDLTQNRAALTAMGDLPRDVRASQLCTTELREQLRYGTPPFRPELLPAYQLESGNVLAVPNAAFRADGAWYNLNFRCTVDDGALRVIDFALKVGNAIPRDEWRARGFPDF